MAKSTVTLQEEENYYFHVNYAYMWKKLNTAPYYVSGGGETPSWIKATWELPSYVNLSRCLNPQFVPSLNIVNKIVRFYNLNLKPEVDSYRFLHEKLELTAQAGHEAETEAGAFTGVYRCYYYLGNRGKKTVAGGLMKITETRGTLNAEMISGFSEESDFTSPALLKLFAEPDITVEAYKEFRAGLEIGKRRVTLFKGTATVTPGMLYVELGALDRDGAMLLFRCTALPQEGEKFLGNVGLTALVDKQEMQLCKLGLVRTGEKGITPMTLDDEGVASLLEMEKLPNEHIALSFREAADWNDLILAR